MSLNSCSISVFSITSISYDETSWFASLSMRPCPAGWLQYHLCPVFLWWFLGCLPSVSIGFLPVQWDNNTCLRILEDKCVTDVPCKLYITVIAVCSHSYCSEETICTYFRFLRGYKNPRLSLSVLTTGDDWLYLGSLATVSVIQAFVSCCKPLRASVGLCPKHEAFFLLFLFEREYLA